MPVYIGHAKQDMTVISSDKKVYVRCSVLGLFCVLYIGESTTVKDNSVTLICIAVNDFN